VCLDFINTYKNIGVKSKKAVGSVEKLENIFEVLLDFAQNAENMPNDLKDPPLSDWEITPDNIHPRYALNYVMRLLNELKRQQDETGRPKDFYTNPEKYMEKNKSINTIHSEV